MALERPYPLRITVDRDPPPYDEREPRGFVATREGSRRVGRGISEIDAIADLLAARVVPGSDRPGRGQSPPHLKLLAGGPDD